MSDRKKTGKTADITASPEKPKETVRDEEEAMGSVFLNEPDPRMRKEQGSRAEHPGAGWQKARGEEPDNA